MKILQSTTGDFCNAEKRNKNSKQIMGIRKIMSREGCFKKSEGSI
jgi:hypothetical protein